MGQSEYAAIDRHARNAPASAAQSIPSLAAYLCGSPARTDEQRLRAIYVWITHHIAYRDSTDGKELWSKPEDIRRQQAIRVLQNRTAVCLGYSNLFCALATEAGIPCQIVTGIVRAPDGPIERIAHAWVAARADRKWHLFDPTWGVPPEGGERPDVDERYFMTAPEDFAVYHLPDDPMWQFLERPLRESEFRSTSDAAIRAYILQKSDTPFDYKDTLYTWLRLDSTSRSRRSVYRILHFNSGNERIVLQLGRSFYKDFFELKFVLDSITRTHIFKTEERIDTTRFLKNLALLEQYYRRAGELFGQLRDPERIERAGKMYTAEQMEGLLAQLRGDMYMAVWYEYARRNPDVTTEQPLRWLHKQGERVGTFHEKALQALTNDSLFANERRDIRNLVSIRYWTLANRHLSLAQNYVDNEGWQKKHPGVVELSVQTAKRLLQSADSAALLLYLHPWYAPVVRERVASIRRSAITASVVDIRLEQQAWMRKVVPLTAARFLEESDILSVVRLARQTDQDIERVLDSLSNAQLPYERGFIQSMQVNVLSDLHEAQMRQGDLYYRVAVFAYNKAVEDSNKPERKERITGYCDQAIRWFTQASRTLTQLEKTGKSSKDAIQKSRLQTNGLIKAVEEIRNGFR